MTEVAVKLTLCRVESLYTHTKCLYYIYIYIWKLGQVQSCGIGAVQLTVLTLMMVVSTYCLRAAEKKSPECEGQP